jgi:SAM-dependent methyltransferase
VPVSTQRTFDDLVSEADSVPVTGWDFSWLEGRATEERASWGYTRMLARRLKGIESLLDIQTGGGEVLAEALSRVDCGVPKVCATESWKPNAELAKSTLLPLGALVIEVGDEEDLPFPVDCFDLVVSRHPTVTLWDEIARVLSPGGTYLSQQVGAGSNRELIDFMMGIQPVSQHRSTNRAASQAAESGLKVIDVREETLRTVFNDVGAVVYFLKKVLWTVPSFTVETYRDRLADLHGQIERDGPFVAHSERFLIEARKPRE